MLPPFLKTRPQTLSLEVFNSLTRLMSDYPPANERFLESYAHVLRLIGARGGSVYLFEPKAELYLLKTYHGARPAKLSLSCSVPFMSYLKLQPGPVARSEFVSGAHEMRSSALYFFQQTAATRVYPLADGERRLALMPADFADKREKEMGVADAVMAFYGETLKAWRLCQDIMEENRKLSELGLVKNQLLANVTHELNTPLNGILGVTEGILDGSDGELTGTLKAHLEMVRSSAKELSATVENIVKLTRIESKKHEVRFERTHMPALVVEVAALYEPAIRAKGIRYVGPVCEKVHDVFVEPDQIRTVLMNLIGNAVKFTEKGEIAVSVKKNGAMLQVSIADTGIGIDEEKLGRIFEEFYQADSSPTRVYGGTGLGLAIVKKVVVLHGGRVWVESRRGSGSRFTFTLPLFP